MATISNKKSELMQLLIVNIKVYEVRRAIKVSDDDEEY